MRQERIQKEKRPAPRRFDVYAVLPLDPRDPDIVRVKARQREKVRCVTPLDATSEVTP